MGNFNSRFVGDPQNLPGKNPQSFYTFTFPAFFKQKLQAKADSQKGNSFLNHFFNDLLQLVSSDFSHGIPERAYTGQDHSVSVQDYFPVSGNDCLFPQFKEGFFHAFNIACIIVNNRRHFFLRQYVMISSSSGRISWGTAGSSSFSSPGAV